MQYFKHFTKMRSDTKIRRLFAKYGLEGYGLYNLILESIAGNIDTENPLPFLEETCDDIASFYNGNSARIEEMVLYMIAEGLFSIETADKKIACYKIYGYLEQSQTRSSKIRELITAYKDKRESIESTDCLRLSETKVIEETKNKTKKRIDIDKTFVPPTLKEVEAYCKEKGYNIDSKAVFDYYDSLEWHDKEGNKIANWKNRVVNWAIKPYNQLPKQAGATVKAEKFCTHPTPSGPCGGRIKGSACIVCFTNYGIDGKEV